MKLTRNERNIIIGWSKNKPINIASAKIIQRKFKSISQKQKKKIIDLKKYPYQLSTKH